MDDDQAKLKAARRRRSGEMALSAIGGGFLVLRVAQLFEVVERSVGLSLAALVAGAVASVLLYRVLRPRPGDGRATPGR